MAFFNWSNTQAPSLLKGPVVNQGLIRASAAVAAEEVNTGAGNYIDFDGRSRGLLTYKQ